MGIGSEQKLRPYTKDTNHTNHHVSPTAFLIASSNARSSRLLRKPKIISASWPTGTRNGVAGSSIALAMANATTSGPGGPDGPVVLVSAPAHCSHSPAYSAGPL